MVSDSDVDAATAIVTDRLARYLDEQQQLAVAPTVTALRARATAVIDAELRRLDGRLPDLDPGDRAEVAAAVRRAVEKVLHAPTVRVKELAATPDGDRYAAALRALFDLDPASPETVVAIRADRPARGGPSRPHRFGHATLTQPAAVTTSCGSARGPASWPVPRPRPSSPRSGWPPLPPSVTSTS